MSLARYEMQGRVAVVHLDNPPMNALDPETKRALGRVFAELDGRRDQMRAVVLAGAGEKAFAAGADIKSFPQLTPETAKRRLMETHRIYQAVEDFHWPVIAAIHGYCLGGGLELALACDVRYASAGASFGFPEVKLSIFPGNGGCYRALKVLGLGRFKELVYSGATMDAEEAKACGLVERVVEPGRHLEAAVELAERIARRGPLGVAMAKKAINRTRDLGRAEALEVESDLWAALTATEDMKEGARAFLEKRKPDYRCR
jgi:enoyl-CoA hydratase/carnithine racemase